MHEGTGQPRQQLLEAQPIREGKPVVRATDTIPITVILPTGTMPADGFPVIVFGHGLGGSRHDALNIAEPRAAQGYAIVAIDMAGHGSRDELLMLPTAVATSWPVSGAVSATVGPITAPAL